MYTYKTIIEENSTQFTEKHSRFIGYVCHTETDEEAVAFIEKIRTLNSDSRHNVYAYVLNKENRARYSDDGEPHGTAGKPILDIINGLELKDVTVVVTRYFGGILLGTGGLVRAYSKAAKDTLDSSEKFLMVPGTRFSACCEYSQYEQLMSIISSYDGTVINTVYENKINIQFSVPTVMCDRFINSINEVFSSQIVAEPIGEEYTKQKISVF